jgi:hypothetical protein
VKVPKSLRRGILGEFLTSGAGQALVAALIIKAAQRLSHEVTHTSQSAASAGNGAQPSWADHAAHAGNEAAGAAHDATLNVKHALAQAARHFILGLSHPKTPKEHRPGSGAAYGSRRDAANGPVKADLSGPDELAVHPH